MHPVFNRALATEPRHRVYGLPLLPLTVGHLFVLREVRSPFVEVEQREKTLGDILFAAFICAHHWSEARRSLENRKGLDRWIAKWASRCRGIDLVKEVDKFFSYFSYYLTKPFQEDNGGAILQCPHEWVLLAILMADFHCTEEEAKDCSVAFATSLWCANAERLGKVRFTRFDSGWTARLSKSLEAQKRLDQKIKAEADAMGLSFSEFVRQGHLGKVLNN